jgi:uncharacterized protein YggU (UPF0235/DUF167 family)
MKPLTISAKVRTRSRDRGLEIDDMGTYIIRTPVAPDRNKANVDVIAILSEHFKIPKGCVTIVSGQTSNRKIIKILAP